MDAPRSAPAPPRCRGAELPNGHYSGCSYGYGDWEPYTGPCDCEVCGGSGIEGAGGGTPIPHSDHGEPECCGCLYAILRAPDQAEIKCNECGATVRTVPIEEVTRTLAELEASMDMATAICPRCGSVNLLPGFTHLCIRVPKVREIRPRN